MEKLKVVVVEGSRFLLLLHEAKSKKCELDEAKQMLC